MSAIDDRVRRKARRAKRGTPEDDIQIKIVAELHAAGVGFFHVPNESMVPVQYRSKLRQKGLSKGVPDLIFVTSPPNYAMRVAAALEIKSDTGKLSDEQRQWLEYCRAMDWLAACTRGYAETRATLVKWGYLEP